MAPEIHTGSKQKEGLQEDGSIIVDIPEISDPKLSGMEFLLNPFRLRVIIDRNSDVTGLAKALLPHVRLDRKEIEAKGAFALQGLVLAQSLLDSITADQEEVSITFGVDEIVSLSEYGVRFRDQTVVNDTFLALLPHCFIRTDEVRDVMEGMAKALGIYTAPTEESNKTQDGE